MTRAGATIDVARTGGDEESETPELVVTITLKLGSGPVSPQTARLTALLEQLAAAGEEVTPAAVDVVADDHPCAVVVYPDSRAVVRGGDEIQLTRREFDLLLCLAQNPVRVFTRAQLLAQVWDNQYTGQRSVDVHVLRLRAKIGLDVLLVMTLRGVGYRLHSNAMVRVARGTFPQA